MLIRTFHKDTVFILCIRSVYLYMKSHSERTSAAAARSPPRVTGVWPPVAHRRCLPSSFGGALCVPRPPWSTPSEEATPGTACGGSRETRFRVKIMAPNANRFTFKLIVRKHSLIIMINLFVENISLNHIWWDNQLSVQPLCETGWAL